MNTASHSPTIGPESRNPRHPSVCLLPLLVLVALIASGCLAPKAYLDPSFRRAKLSEIKPPANPKPLTLEASFQVNGAPKPAVNKLVLTSATKVLRATRFFSDIDQRPHPQGARLELVVNDYGDMGAAAANGVKTGLTLGAAGSEVVDNYEMKATYSAEGATPVTKSYKHAIHTTIGAHSAPAGLEPVPLQLGFEQVMEDMLLNLLDDLQKDGAL